MNSNKNFIKFFSDKELRINQSMLKSIGVEESIWLIFTLNKLSEKKIDNGGYFKIIKDASRKIGINRKKQTIILKRLRSRKLIKLEKRNNNEIWCKINLKKLIGLSVKNNKKINSKIKSYLSRNQLLDEDYLSRINIFINLLYIPPRGGDIISLNNNPRTITSNQRRKIQNSRKISRRKTEKSDRKIESIRLHWNNLGKPLRNHRSGSTITYSNIVKNVRIVLKKNSYDEILEAIEVYHRFVSSSGVYFKPVPLHIFLRFDNFTKERMEKSGVEAKSWFEECKKGYDYMMMNYSKQKVDKNKNITDKIIQWWKRDLGKEASFSDKNNFVVFGEKLIEFSKKNRKRFVGVDPDYPIRLLKFVKGIIEGKDLEVVHSGFLSNDILFSELANNLIDNGYMRRRN